MKQNEKNFVEENNNVRINPKLIPNIEKKLLCSTFLDAVIRYYKDPENERRFQEWKKKRESSQDK